MNKRIFSLLLFCFLLISLPVSAAEPLIRAKAAVLMDVNSGQVLWERQGTKTLPPASTTKILTAILAYDMGNVNQICTVSPKAASTGEASIHLRVGEQLLLGDLLKGSLICSGNDASVAIAENIAGSENLFVQWMNLKAQILGADSSKFINTNGLPAQGHFVTAYDLALMSRYALHNSYFSSVVRQRFQVIGQGASKRYLKNTNKLLWQYPGCIGVKTGTTIAAGPCLVSAAENGRGKKYLCAVLNSPDRYGDSKKLLEYGFKNFTTITLFHQGDLIRLVKVNNGVKKNVAAEVPFDETISLSQNQSHSLKKIYLIKDQVIAPIKKGQSLGQIKILDKDQRLISRINVVAHESIAENLNWWATFKKNFPFDKIKEFFHLHRNLNS